MIIGMKQEYPKIGGPTVGVLLWGVQIRSQGSMWLFQLEVSL